MPHLGAAGVGILVLCVSAVPGVAEATTIDHAAVACAAAERFPRLEARLTPAESVGRARVLFRPEGGPHWYAVGMVRAGDVFAAALPKPKKSLRSFRYYLEAADTSFATSRTEEYTTDVVAGMAGCRTGMMGASVASASVLLEAPVGATAVPSGFSSAGVVAAKSAAAGAAVAGTAAAGTAVAAGGGVGATTVVLAGAGAVAAGAGVAVATGAIGGGDEDPTRQGESDQPPAEVNGQVFSTFGPNPADRTGPGLYGPPVAGALVASTLDGATARTDGGGNFRLVTQTRLPSPGCAPFTLTITAAGLPTFSVVASWAGGRDGPPLVFSLSPPMPMPFVRAPCSAP
jgi:hypothetical protein